MVFNPPIIGLTINIGIADRIITHPETNTSGLQSKSGTPINITITPTTTMIIAMIFRILFNDSRDEEALLSTNVLF